MNPFARFALGNDKTQAKEEDLKSINLNKLKRQREDTCPEEKRHRRILEHHEDRILTLNRIQGIRNRHPAPIDIYGTSHLIDRTLPIKSQRLHALVASLLSTQTKDEITGAAMQRLHDQPGGLTIDSLMSISIADLDSLLSPVGFHEKKANQIKTIAQILRSEYEDDIPQTMLELTKLPGVGPKVARLTLLIAWGTVDGIIVDTHVHRISSLLKWTHGAKNPENTRTQLEEWLPREYWGTISETLIGFGQTICVAKRPKCQMCPLEQTCPSSVSKTK